MTPTDTEVEQALAGLTKAQARAVADAPYTPLGNVWLRCHGSTKSALVAQRLASGHGDWCTLTTLGKAVRARLKASGMEAHRAETAGLGPKADSPVAKPDAPTTPTQSGDA